MNLRHLIVRRFYALCRRRQLEADMAAEMKAHLEMQEAANRVAGMAPDEAHSAAHRQFGGVDQIKETVRDQRGWVWLEQLAKDFRFSARSLRKTPGFTAVALLTLALGIGVNTAIFSIINNLFFRPLPVRDAGNLVVVAAKTPISTFLRGYEYPNYLDLRDQVDAFSDLMAYSTTPIDLDAPGSQPERTYAAVVTGNYFSFFGVQAALGRLFLPGEGEKIGADPIMVLSHAYWQQRFGGDPSIVGRSVNVNGHPFTVVGIAPAALTSTQAGMSASVFVSVTMVGDLMANGARLLQARAGMPLNVMGRLKPGMRLDQARTEVGTVIARIAKEHPQESIGGTPVVIGERHTRPDPSFTEFMPLISTVFMGLVGLVLLIACANVANLMFARTIVRRREMGIRAALGASRWQLTRQLLAESLLLAASASIVGLVLGYWGAEWLVSFGSSATPVALFGASWDWRVFLFTTVMALLAGLLIGLMPALKASRGDLQTALKEGGSVLLASSRHPFRSILVVSQVAVSLVVLICGGVFLQSLQQVSPRLLGFRTDHLLMASFDLGLHGYDRGRASQFQQRLLEKVRALPGVEAATLGTFVPFALSSALNVVAPEGKVVRGIQDMTITPYGLVAPNFVQTMGMTLLRGRDFSAQDQTGAPLVAIINEEMAAQFWPGQDPVGKRCYVGGPTVIEVVGVVRNGRYKMVGEAPSPFILQPLAQSYDLAPLTLYLRTQGDPVAMAPAVRRLVQELNPVLPLFNVETMDRHLNDGLWALLPLRAGAALAGLQGLLALVLVVTGLYGVASFAVSQRTREIGIRLALGAQKRDVLRLVLGDGLKMTLCGIAIGAVLSLGLTRVLSRILYGLAAGSSPVTLTAVLLLTGIALLACWLPARRATKVNPSETLRAE
jgi:predicted permease